MAEKVENMPIGIIVWLILIFIIVLCECPGFLTMFFVSALIVVVGGYLLYWIGRKLLYLLGGSLAYIVNLFKPGFLDNEDDSEAATKHKSPIWLNESTKNEREKAIDEWEKKWRRKHPTRMNK